MKPKQLDEDAILEMSPEAVSALMRNAYFESALRNRAFVTVMNLAARRNAKEASVNRVLKYIDAGIDQAGVNIAAWRATKFQMLVALDFSLRKPKQIIIAGAKDGLDTRDLLDEVHRHYLPNAVVLLADGSDGQNYLAEKLEELKTMGPIGGKDAACVAWAAAIEATESALAREGSDGVEKRPEAVCRILAHRHERVDGAALRH